MSLIHRFLEPEAERHLLTVEKEVIVDEVHKHWAASFWWYVVIALSAVFFLLMIPAGPFFWAPLAVGLVLLVVGMWKCHVNHMDRFVVTNMRVFRVHGVFNQHLATMPLTRILDISLTQSFNGQIFGYGHFVFESAAQDQGLRDIRFVARPEERDLTIQQVVQRSGLRARMAVDPAH